MPELIPAEPGTPAWLAARRQGVTATDIVSILGIGWKSVYWLYWNKLGQVPDEPDSDRFRLGRELEPIVAARWEETTGRNAHHEGLWRHSDRTWQMATLDRSTHGDGYRAPVELKTWADADQHSWQDGPHVSVRAQVLWQMDVMDAGMGHVGVLFLPSGEFRSYVIEHSFVDHGGMLVPGCEACRDVELMRERGAEFYARLQGERPQPDIDASVASLAAVKARFGDARKDKTAPVDAGLWGEYSVAKEAVRLHEETVRRYENKIREQIGEAGAIEVDGQLVARRLVYDAQVKAHTRHVDSIRRIKQQEGDSE